MTSRLCWSRIDATLAAYAVKLSGAMPGQRLRRTFALNFTVGNVLPLGSAAGFSLNGVRR